MLQPPTVSRPDNTTLLRQQLIDLDTENEELRSSVNRLTADLDDLVSTQGRTARLSAEVKAKSAVIAQLKSTVQSLQNSLASKELIVDELRRKIGALEIELEALQLVVSELKAEHAAAILAAAPKEAAPRSPVKTESPVAAGSAEQKLAQLQQNFAHLDKQKVQIAATLNKHTQELSRVLEEHRQDKVQLERKWRVKCEDIRAEYVKRLAESQSKTGEIICKLEDQVSELRQTVFEHFENPVRSQTSDQGDPSLLERGILSMQLPGSATSIRVPASSLKGREAIVLHVSFPPQDLIIGKEGSTFKLRTLNNAEARMSFVASYDLSTVNK